MSHPGCILVGIAKHQSVCCFPVPGRTDAGIMFGCSTPIGGMAGRVQSALEAAVGVGPPEAVCWLVFRDLTLSR